MIRLPRTRNNEKSNLAKVLKKVKRGTEKKVRHFGKLNETFAI